MGTSTESAVVDAKYAFVKGALAETWKPGMVKKKHRSMTDRIDAIITNKWLAFPIFFLILYIVFFGTFTLGGIPHAVDRLDSREIRGFRRIHNPGRHGDGARPHDRRHHRWGRERAGVPPEHRAALLLHIASRGFRLYGEGGIHHGQADAQDGAAREVLHTDDYGIRMQCPGNHGHKEQSSAA